MRYKVGSKVVAITQLPYATYRENAGGGTGFHVKGPSGKTYIMTNRHVCDDSKDGTMWVAIDGRTKDRSLKIIQKSATADLCLMEGIPGVEGLDIGDTPSIDDELMYIGHPRLQQRTLVQGDLVGSKTEIVVRGEVGKEVKEADCKASKDSYIEQVAESAMVLWRFKHGLGTIDDSTVADNLTGAKSKKKIPVCYEKDQAYVTTLQVYGGASGSPVVDTDGDVVGVIYAGGDGTWGYAVVLADVKALLKGR